MKRERETDREITTARDYERDQTTLKLYYIEMITPSTIFPFPYRKMNFIIVIKTPSHHNTVSTLSKHTLYLEY